MLNNLPPEIKSDFYFISLINIVNIFGAIYCLYEGKWLLVGLCGIMIIAYIILIFTTRNLNVTCGAVRILEAWYNGVSKETLKQISDEVGIASVRHVQKAIEKLDERKKSTDNEQGCA